MKAYKDKNYVTHYCGIAEDAMNSVKKASEESKDIPRFLQRLWELGYKLEPIKIQNKKSSLAEAICVLQTMMNKSISDYHVTKIADILMDCDDLE